MKHEKWMAAKAFNTQLLQNLEANALFNQWLELDKNVNHDGDAEVTDTEREQWEIERKLDGLGFRVAYDLVTQQIGIRRRTQ